MTALLCDIQELSARFQAAGIEHALGGTGMLSLLGIEIEVEDWDLTTDAEEGQVLEVINRFNPEKLATNSLYDSSFAYHIRVGESDCDVVGNFAVITGGEIVRCTTVVTKIVQGIPLGSVEQWQAVYRALGQTEKVRLLESVKE